MIIGGFDRNLNLDNLVNAIKENSQTIKKVLLIGQSRIRVAVFLDNIDYNNYKIIESKNMEEIVKEANAIAQPGDSIVLSPGFPSFDMFKNFEQRGEEFKQAVINL
jgi:UDP-N-acetylmuramoylalanine--D-glutamate ligase